MRSLSRGAPLLAFAFLLVVVPVLPAAAAQIDGADVIVITEDRVFPEDLYAAANRILVRGTIDGDLIAVAAQDVRIEGVVTGSVTVLAPEVVVTGEVGGSLRATGGTVTVTGEVGGDLVMAASRLELADTGRVAGDVVSWSWTGAVAGAVGRDLGGTIRNLTLGGDIGRDVSVTVGGLTVTPGLTVAGDLTYRSNSVATGIEDADVGGVVVHQTPVPPNIRIRALFIAVKVVLAIMLSAMALLVASSWPERTERALDGVKKRPLRSVLFGLGVVLSPLLVVAIAFGLFAVAPPEASLPLIAVLIPVLFATLGIVMVLGLVAGVPAAAAVGSLIRRKATLAGAVAVGSAVIAVLWLIPVVGWIFGLAAMVLGMGGWITGRGPVTAT